MCPLKSGARTAKTGVFVGLDAVLVSVQREFLGASVLLSLRLEGHLDAKGGKERD